MTQICYSGNRNTIMVNGLSLLPSKLQLTITQNSWQAIHGSNLKSKEKKRNGFNNWKFMELQNAKLAHGEEK